MINNKFIIYFQKIYKKWYLLIFFYRKLQKVKNPLGMTLAIFFSKTRITIFINMLIKIVHGKWSQWANWSSWTKCAPSHYNKCIGEEVKKRIRHCNNPTPQHKGNNCYGSGIQTHSKGCPLKSKRKEIFAIILFSSICLYLNLYIEMGYNFD